MGSRSLYCLSWVMYWVALLGGAMMIIAFEIETPGGENIPVTLGWIGCITVIFSVLMGCVLETLAHDKEIDDRWGRK